jgi:hypothetical protein
VQDDKPATQSPDVWSIYLTSDRVAYVRGNICRPHTADALLAALRTIEPLLPAAADLEIDEEWAE